MTASSLNCHCGPWARNLNGDSPRRSPPAASATTPTAKPGRNAGKDATAGTDQAVSGTADNRLIAKVDDVEIRLADVVNAIQGLPPQIQQMPPQILLSVVVEQLLLRELILEQARSGNLQSDPEVTAQVGPQMSTLRFPR